MFGADRNDWHADHGMSCENPNSTHRTIHLTSQQQAGDAAFYYCMPEGNQDKGHVMTTVNTEGYVTVWFSPKPIFRNVSKVCWDQNITDLGGGKWTVVNFLTPAEYAGKTGLGYTSPDFPKGGGPSSPQGPAANGVKVFSGAHEQLHQWAVSRGRTQRHGIGLGGPLQALRRQQRQRNADHHDRPTERQDGLTDGRRQDSRRRYPRPVRRRQLQSGQALRRKGSGAKLDRAVHVALG